jgi:serine/threonine-protein kinase
VPTGLVGTERAAAEAVLAAADLKVDVTEAFDPEVPAGVVVSASPAEGESVRKDGTVALVVSLGPDMRTVPPDLVGQPVADVVAALEAAGFTVPEPAHDFHDTVPADAVISMSADAGASLPVSTVVTLLVSDGPAPLSVSDVTGMERQAGIVELESQGLVVEVPTEDFSETVPTGSIISQSPAGGTAGHRGDHVTLVVSKGPPLVLVPNVVNKSEDDARAALEAAGFAVNVEKQWFWDTMVVDQDPEPDIALPKGSTITIWVQ